MEKKSVDFIIKGGNMLLSNILPRAFYFKQGGEETRMVDPNMGFYSGIYPILTNAKIDGPKTSRPCVRSAGLDHVKPQKKYGFGLWTLTMQRISLVLFYEREPACPFW